MVLEIFRVKILQVKYLTEQKPATCCCLLNKFEGRTVNNRTKPTVHCALQHSITTLRYLPALAEMKPKAKGGVSPNCTDTLTLDTEELINTGASS